MKYFLVDSLQNIPSLYYARLAIYFALFILITEQSKLQSNHVQSMFLDKIL